MIIAAPFCDGARGTRLSSLYRKTLLMSFIRNYYEPNCTNRIDDCDPKILPTSDKRGHTRAKRAHHGKRESQTENLNRKEPSRPTKKIKTQWFKKRQISKAHTPGYFLYLTQIIIWEILIYICLYM